MSVSVQQVEQLISQGRYLEARNLAEAGYKSADNTLRFQQLYALALSKSGIPQAAEKFLLPIYTAYKDDPETAGILGGIYKEIFREYQDNSYALLSRDTYAENFEQTKNYYTGINAATMSAIAGKINAGRTLAGEVMALLDDKTDDFWELMTLAEANLLTKNRDKCVELYFKGKQLAGSDWGKINIIYKQLWLLNHYLPVPPEVLKAFKPPLVIGFVGHMIDHPSRPNPRFPPSIEKEIKEEIAHTIQSLNARIGYCSLACGADILFAESMIEQGGEVNAFIPFAKEDFLETSVRFAGDGWISRFNNLLENTSVNYLTSEKYNGVNDLFSLQSRVIFGSAILRSRLLNGEVNLLTVLSEFDLKRKTGGTRETMRYWPYPDKIHNINPDKYLQSRGIDTKPVMAKDIEEDSEASSDIIVTYLCCMKFPRRNKEEIAEFWNKFKSDNLGLSLNLLPYALKDNTIFILFPSAHSGIESALTFILRYNDEDIKVSFDTGPVTITNKQEDQRSDISGNVVNLAEAINLYAQPGKLICTTNFAAVAVISSENFTLQYSGVVYLGDNNDKGTSCELYQIESAH